MNVPDFLSRLRAMLHIGDAAGRVATVTRVAAVEARDAERLLLLGDIDGQTERARAFAAELDKRVSGAR